MSFSRACKLITLGAIGVASIIVLVFVYHRGRGAQLCPDKGDLLHKENNKCYPRESKGPCNHNLIFLEEKYNSQIGQCSCPYTMFDRTILYHKEGERCYFVYTQAYCEEGHWLTVKKDGNEKGTPICEKNQCLQHSFNRVEQKDEDKHSFNYSGAEFVPVKGGGCTELGLHAEGCSEGSVVRFHKGYILPSCKTPPEKPFTIHSSTIGVPPATCPLGSYPSIMGRCQPDFQFDFE